MKITRISANATDLETIYDGLKKALQYLNQNYIGKTKNEIKKAIKDLEKVRPHLKYKGRPVRRKW
jgi:hypothetical protein